MSDMICLVEKYGCYRRTVARPVNLAQASQSCLGEINRELAQDFRAEGRPGDQFGF